MNTLRAKFAILLVVAIVGVVALATTIAVTLVRRPALVRTVDATAEQLHDIRDLALAQPTGPDGRIGSFELLKEPMIAGRLEHLERIVGQAIARTGRPFDFVVAQERPDTAPLVSLKIGDRGWIVVPIPDRPIPENIWPALTGWMALVVAGALAIALLAAAKITRPLVVLQEAVARAGDDGMLPHIPETGPAEVRATAVALNTLSARLKASMESRMRLVAAAGHDLRTPLTRMRLRAEFLLDEDRAAWLSDLEELDGIADSAIRLVREEVETDLEPQDVPLDELIRTILAEITETGGRAEAALLTPATVRAPPLALKRALRNLVHNAVVHGGGARVSLSIEATHALVTIDDEGPGIPPELMDRVFEPFFRVDPARRKSTPGAGLGLAIAHEIIGRIGGTLICANKAPKGLRQSVRLPFDLSDR